MKVFVLSLLLSSQVYAGSYAGINLNYDNDRGFCTYSSLSGYCTTARGFVGFDTELSKDVYFDAHVSIEDQLNDDSLYNPKKASVTIMKRW